MISRKEEQERIIATVGETVCLEVIGALLIESLVVVADVEFCCCEVDDVETSGIFSLSTGLSVF